MNIVGDISATAPVPAGGYMPRTMKPGRQCYYSYKDVDKIAVIASQTTTGKDDIAIIGSQTDTDK